MTRIKNIAIAGLAALGLTLAPVPAAADSEDVAKVLLGLAAVGLIAKAAKDRNDRNDRAVQWYDGSRNDRHGNRTIEGTILRPNDWRSDQSAKKKYKRRALPERCLRIVDTDRRDRLAYERRCLNRNYKHASSLPRDCQVRVRTNRGVQVVYGARCLARDGWRVASR